MSATATKKLLTAEEFAKLPNPLDGSKQELVCGEIVTARPVLSFKNGMALSHVAFALLSYARQTQSGRVAVKSGLVVERDPDTVRGLDVAFWSYERLPADQVPVVYANVAPDLCVEIKSPGNTPARMTKKVGEYFNCGARMVWVVDPDERTVTVYTKPGDGRVLWDDAVVTGEDVLPGFTCPVAEFFQ